MGVKSSIEWTDSTWSALRARVRHNAGEIALEKGYSSLVEIGNKMAGRVGQHCEHVSDGCKFCYSGTWQSRCLPVNGTGLPFDRRSRDLIESIVDEKALMLPMRWRSARKIFVENQSDLFGEWITDAQIDRVFAVMALCPQHKFQILTKRPERMRQYLELTQRCAIPGGGSFAERLPLPNVWLGVSVENQATADARIPLLLQTPAAKRFVSYEPALGPVKLLPYIGHETFLCKCGWHETQLELQPFGGDNMCLRCLGTAKRFPALDWIITGGESGPGARPADPDWFRSVRDQCAEAGVPFFFKQWGDWLPAGCDGARIEGEPHELNSSDAPIRVGKKKAGALLDGREHREFPAGDVP